jgi:dTDP-glucose 4,6-dehydratase
LKVRCHARTKWVPSKHDNISKYAQLITFVDDRAGHDIRYAIDASKIKDKLNWIPDETFATGLKKTIEWYLANATWCERVKDGSYQGERLGVIKKWIK